MRDDFKAAFRSLRGSPTFTLVALAVLTLGIGAATTIFSIVDGVALRPLPFPEPARLVAVGERRSPEQVALLRTGDPQMLMAIAPQNYRDWTLRQQVFESMAAFATMPMTLQEPGAEPEELRASQVTSQYFEVLRVRAASGRTFVAADEVEGSHRVAVLSDRFWRRRFGGDPTIVGKAIPIDGAAYQVVGITPQDFQYPVGSRRPLDLWVPFVPPPADRVRIGRSSSSYLSAFARLKPGVSIETARADLDRIAADLQREHPEWSKDRYAGVRPLHAQTIGGPLRAWMLMLLGAVALLLVIACANVANLMLVRASTRAREIGVRAALGAGRRELVRALAAEGVLLCAAGTVLALAVSYWGVGILRAAMPDAIPRVGAIALDLRVFGLAALVAGVTMVLSAVVPALGASRPDLTGVLRDGGRGSTGGAAGRRTRHALVIVEVALAVVLVTAAALFIQSFRNVMRVDLGFETSNVLTMSVTPRLPASQPGGPQPDARAQLEALTERLGRVPGVVQAAAIAGGTPLTMSRSSAGLSLPGEASRGEEAVSARRVTPAYHQALGIPLKQGRLFSPEDKRDAPLVLIINELAAREFFAGRSPVGEHVKVNGELRTIVGVVGNVHQNAQEIPPVAEIYLPMAQARTTGADILLRTSSDPYAVLPAARAAALDVIRDVPLRNARSLDDALARHVAQRRLNMMLIGLFGAVAMAISAAGIYGTMAFAVAQRRREIGIRMALGATRRQVMASVMTGGAILTLAGLVVGVAGARLLAGVARAFLFDVNAGDPRALGVAVVLLAGATLAATAVPAARAAAIDPAESLRTQ